MPDREKIIASLGNALVQMHGCGRYTPEDVDELETAAWKALELLEEQDAVKPTWNRGKPFCGACGLLLRGRKFCSECGKPIAWEGR